MRQASEISERCRVLDSIRYLVGSAELLEQMPAVPVREPFDEEVLDFLNAVSRLLFGSPGAREYPDVITLAFWLRRASTDRLKARFACGADDCLQLGRGVVFHIAPSNVAVNYAYSLASGLLAGNANVLRLPSRDFPQVGLVNRAIEEALARHEALRPYICLVRYERNRAVNDLLSALVDVRVIWGGDATIAELRKSPLAPRAGEVTFADRFSFSVIDSEAYMALEDKKALAERFYNDTYLSDQNACTSPRLVVWLGARRDEAKERFWRELHEAVSKRYRLKPVQAINKLTSACLLAARCEGVRFIPRADNLIFRVSVSAVDAELIELRDNSGYFFEYDCEDILELRELCSDPRCQTIGLLGGTELLRPLLLSGVRGVDRVVPIGRTMDFSIIWDGYDLMERLTRKIQIYET